MKIGKCDINLNQCIVVLAVLVDIQGAIGKGTVSLTNMVPADWIPGILAWNAFLAFVGTTIMGALAMPGALAGRNLPAVTPSTIARILLVAFVLSLLFPATSALAQGARGRQQQMNDPFKAVGDKIRSDVDDASRQAAVSTAPATQSAREKLGCDLLNLKPGCKTAKAADDFKNLDDAMSEPMKEFVAFVQGDVSTAISLTSKIDGLPDGNGQACLQQLQISGNIVKSLQDTVSGGGTVGIATAFEALRLLHMNMIKTCNNKACTQMFNEATNVIAAAAPMKAQIPSLTQLCSQIPSIAMEPVTPVVAAAVTVPVAAASPTPAPTPSASATPIPAQQ